MLVEPVDNLCGRFSFGVHREYGLYSLCSYWLYLILPVCSNLIPKTRATHSDSMQSVFFETSLDTSSKVFRVVFSVPFENRFQNDTLGSVRHGLFRIVDLDPVLFELGLVDG